MSHPQHTACPDSRPRCVVANAGEPGRSPDWADDGPNDKRPSDTGAGGSRTLPVAAAAVDPLVETIVVAIARVVICIRTGAKVIIIWRRPPRRVAVVRTARARVMVVQVTIRAAIIIRPVIVVAPIRGSRRCIPILERN